MPRGRPPSPNPAIPLEVSLDPGLRARLDLLLYSEVEQRVPRGAYKRFFESLLVAALDWTQFDLSPYAGTLPGELTLRARPEVVAKLRSLLERNPS